MKFFFYLFIFYFESPKYEMEKTKMIRSVFTDLQSFFRFGDLNIFFKIFEFLKANKFYIFLYRKISIDIPGGIHSFLRHINFEPLAIEQR